MAAASNGEDKSKQLLTQEIENLSITSDIILTICANCGKEGSNLNTCNKCKGATYCNASCKKKHRSKHKVDVKGVWQSYMRKYLSVKDVPLNYMMNHSSNGHRRLKIAQSVCYLYLRFIQGGSINLAVGKLYAVDAFMQL